MVLDFTKGREELFDERDSLTEEIRNLQAIYNERLEEVKEDFIPKINKLAERISEIRSKLHELGVSAEDC